MRCTCEKSQTLSVELHFDFPSTYGGPCRVLVVLQELLALLQRFVLLVLVAATADPDKNSGVDSVQNKAVLQTNVKLVV